jgi:hypothetical protein
MAAIDRIVGGVFDIPAAYLDGKAAKIRARDGVQVALIHAEGKAAIAQLFNDPEFGARVAEQFITGEARKQINREAVATIAIEHLQEEPATLEQDTAGDVDDDWMNMFEAGAEKATSQHLRQLWGRVLAGEIRKSGSFSLSTIRFISELDSTIAAKFQSYASNRINNEQIIKPKKLVNELLKDLIFLEACGLLQGVLANLGFDFDSESGYVNYRQGDLVLHLKTAQRKVRLEFIYITRIGSEIASILPPVDLMESLTAVGEYFSDVSTEATICHVIQDNADGSFTMQPIKVLKRAEPQTD